jgi:hypothetical protein
LAHSRYTKLFSGQIITKKIGIGATDNAQLIIASRLPTATKQQLTQTFKGRFHLGSLIAHNVPSITAGA